MNLDSDYFFVCVDPEGDWVEWVREQADSLRALGRPPHSNGPGGDSRGGLPSARPSLAQLDEAGVPPFRPSRALDNFPGRPAYKRLPDPEA